MLNEGWEYLKGCNKAWPTDNFNTNPKDGKSFLWNFLRKIIWRDNTNSDYDYYHYHYSVKEKVEKRKLPFCVWGGISLLESLPNLFDDLKLILNNGTWGSEENGEGGSGKKGKDEKKTEVPAHSSHKKHYSNRSW